MTQGATWTITHKLSYDMGFVELPKNLQRKATQAQVELAQDPITPRGKRIKPLKGWENVYRYRLGGYRLIYSASEARRVVQLLAIGPRSDVYQRFNYEPEGDQPDMISFGPELAAELTPRQQLPPWVEHPEWYGPQEEREPLPRKLTPSQLGRWRVPDQHHEALIRCRTEDDLFEADIPAEVLGIVMEALWPATVDQIAGQPDLRLFRPEDLERYAEGTLRGFLLHLDEQQRRFTNWALAGPTLVKGGPGSGKSTVALYRVRALVERALETTGEIPDILFATYTNPLINFSRSLLIQLLCDLAETEEDQLPRSIRVSTVDKTVMWIAKASGECPGLADEDAQLESLHVAQAALKPRAMGDMEKLQATMAVRALRDSYLLSEFEWVIEGQDCRQLDDYLVANRAGRGIPFNETARRGVWQLYQQYREHLKGENLCTWGQLRQFALDRVRKGEFTRRWDHVIIDEAQDLTPAALALCVELAREPGGVFLTADANQSLYNRSFRWSRVHDDLQVTGRTRILRRNYRSTRQIALAAADLLTSVDEYDADAIEQEYVHMGTRPVIYPAGGAADQAGWLAARIGQACRELRLPINGAAVLVPSNSLARSLAELLDGQGLPTRYVASRDVHLEERCVKVMTLHAAKGLEFPIVAIAHVEADRLPRETSATDPQEIQEHLNNQRQVLYVGCTRAMRHLFITHDRSLPSPFLADLTAERWVRMGEEGPAGGKAHGDR